MAMADLLEIEISFGPTPPQLESQGCKCENVEMSVSIIRQMCHKEKQVSVKVNTVT